MLLPEIKDPNDWHVIQSMLKNMIRNTPEFIHDYSKLVNNIELKIKDLCIIDIEIKRQQTKFLNQKRKDKLREINDIIRMFSKMHLLASLSKR
jgi:hypothetical protein